MTLTRRHFISSVTTALGGSALAASGKPKTVLLQSAWDTVNIGDIGHTPGTLRVIEQHLPEVKVILWAMKLDERVTTRFVPSTLLCARALPMTLMHSRLGGARFEQAAAALVRDVESGGFVVVGRVMQLSYDPPWTPPFARRDEVAVEVREV